MYTSALDMCVRWMKFGLGSITLKKKKKLPSRQICETRYLLQLGTGVALIR